VSSNMEFGDRNIWRDFILILHSHLLCTIFLSISSFLRLLMSIISLICPIFRLLSLFYVFHLFAYFSLYHYSLFFPADPIGRATGSNPAGGHGCLSVVSVVCVVRRRSLLRADHSSRGVVPNVRCLRVIVKPRR
jgi:hypothetical protein